MARLMNHFTASEKKHYTILTATSGDTGSAVASAFHGLENIEVVILFPLEEVSDTQRKQMTTLKGNVRVIAVKGKFDDCQRIVKKAFLDNSLSDLSLTSAIQSISADCCRSRFTIFLHGHGQDVCLWYSVYLQEITEILWVVLL